MRRTVLAGDDLADPRGEAPALLAAWRGEEALDEAGRGEVRAERERGEQRGEATRGELPSARSKKLASRGESPTRVCALAAASKKLAAGGTVYSARSPSDGATSAWLCVEILRTMVAMPVGIEPFSCR